MSKTQIEKDIDDLHAQFRSIYNPETAFGNVFLLKIGEEIAQKQKLLEDTGICRSCEGSGEVAHFCDCPQCHADEEECTSCEGTGRVANKITVDV